MLASTAEVISRVANHCAPSERCVTTVALERGGVGWKVKL